jgi:hypothetical protein
MIRAVNGRGDLSRRSVAKEEAVPSKHMQRRRAYLLNRLKVPPGPETAAMLKTVHEGMRPPQDWDGKSYRPPSRTATVRVPTAWLDMAEYLAPAQGMTRARFLSALLGEQLYDIWEEARKQHRQSAEATQPAKVKAAKPRTASPSTAPDTYVSDLGDDIPI